MGAAPHRVPGVPEDEQAQADDEQDDADQEEDLDRRDDADD